jgi:hypothetical protein
MQVKVKFIRRPGQGAAITIDASELHAFLDEQGVPKDAAGNYADPPRDDYELINTYRHKISPRALTRPGVQTINLADHYSSPVGPEVLESLANSVGAVVRSVVDHYRPIEISVIVTGKKAA